MENKDAVTVEELRKVTDLYLQLPKEHRLAIIVGSTMLLAQEELQKQKETAEPQEV